MNYDEFAFANQQLAGMLKSGLPLEGALKQLCSSMRRGELREEFDRFAADLSTGTPLAQALTARKFPPLYIALLRIGQASNDLPSVLTLVADHYRRVNDLWTRLKGLMVYPVIVLCASLALSVLIGVGYQRFTREIVLEMGSLVPGSVQPIQARMLEFQVWAPVFVLAAVLLVVAFMVRSRRLRQRLRWIVPGFKEASIAGVAGSLGLMLSRGCQLPEALELIRQVETDPRLSWELGRWQKQLAEGATRFSTLTSGGQLFPPLFTWLVSANGENWCAGFQQASEVFHARALNRIEIGLYASLPVSILVLGTLILGQLSPVYSLLNHFMTLLGSDTQ